MLKHNKLKPVGIAIRLMWNMDKWLLIHSIITSVIEAATPFAGILLSAYILDGLQAGEEFTEIISVSLGGCSRYFPADGAESLFFQNTKCTYRYVR